MEKPNGNEGIYIFEKLSINDWRGFKEILLEAQKTDSGSFGRFLEENIKKDEAGLKEVLSSTEEMFYCIKSGNLIVSIAGVKDINDPIWKLFSVYTRPEFRSKGFSKKIIESILLEAKKFADKVCLFVETNQENAIKLYEGLGFNKVENEITHKTHKMADGQEHSLFYMEKVLEKDI